MENTFPRFFKARGAMISASTAMYNNYISLRQIEVDKILKENNGIITVQKMNDIKKKLIPLIHPQRQLL